MEELNVETIQKIFADEDTRKKIMLRVELLQRERFLHIEARKLRNKVDELDMEIRNKHKLPIMANIMLDIICEQEEYKDFLKNYGKDYKKPPTSKLGKRP